MFVETFHRTFLVTDTGGTSLWQANSTDTPGNGRRFIGIDDFAGIDISGSRILRDGEVASGPLQGYRVCSTDGGNTFSLVRNGLFLCAEAGTEELVCNRPVRGTWESFRINNPNAPAGEPSNGRSDPPFLHPDSKFVGLPDLPAEASFPDLFRDIFAPRLDKRAESFGLMFNRLMGTGRSDLTIVETGCLRAPGNWQGDGQSSFMFDALVTRQGGSFLSVDASVDSVKAARQACSSRSNIVLNDSVAFLHSLSDLGSTRRIDLLYLDSFDLDWSNPLPSAIHHMKELTAAWPLLGRGSLVCVDDYNVSGDRPGGKGLIVDDFLANIRARVLFEGYQKVWVID